MEVWVLTSGDETEELLGELVHVREVLEVVVVWVWLCGE